MIKSTGTKGIGFLGAPCYLLTADKSRLMQETTKHAVNFTSVGRAVFLPTVRPGDQNVPSRWGELSCLKLLEDSFKAFVLLDR